MTTVPPLTACQPRFALYCLTRGLQEGDEWHTWEYMAWIEHMATEYKQTVGERYISDHDAFTQWIREQVDGRQLTLGLAI